MMSVKYLDKKVFKQDTEILNFLKKFIAELELQQQKQCKVSKKNKLFAVL